MLANELMDQFKSVGTERIAVLGVGLPGLGKTEPLKETATMFRPEALHLTYGAVRSMLLSEPTDFSIVNEKTQMKRTRRELHATAGQYLQMGGSVVIDIGHTNPNERRVNANFYRQRDFGASAVTAVYFMVKDIETATERARYTNTRISEQGMKIMLENLLLVPPSCPEGFDKVITVDASSPQFTILDVESPY